jgi:hypothetical protein
LKTVEGLKICKTKVKMIGSCHGQGLATLLEDRYAKLVPMEAQHNKMQAVSKVASS